MKIREANPDFKKFEASEKDFSQEALESSRKFLISLVKEDEATLKEMAKKIPRLKELVVYSIKNLVCYDLKIRPECIRVEYEDEDSTSIGSKTLMSWGNGGRIARQQGIFGYVTIYPIMQKQDNIIDFMLSFLHEFRHIYQDVARERGELVAPNVNTKANITNMFDYYWLLFRYCANICELDANLYAEKMVDKWLKEGQAKKFLPKKEYKKKKNFINKKRTISVLTFTLGNFDKAIYGAVLSPYLLSKYLQRKFSYRLPKSGNFDIADENNKVNEKFGYRNVEKAQKYLRKSRRDCHLGLGEKLRILDSMLVVFASKHNIPPREFALIRGAEGKIEGFDFIDARDTGEHIKSFGYIKLREGNLLCLDGVDFFDKMVEYFQMLEEDSLFKLALKSWKGKQSQDSINDENSSN